MIDEYIKKWIIKADNDLKVAKNELSLDKQDTVTDAVCFHAQQAVEKRVYFCQVRNYSRLATIN